MNNDFMNQLMQQAQKMQADMQEAQNRLGAITVEGSAGGGMVTVTANCRNEIVKVSIEPEVIDPEDRDMLEDLVVAATNQALQKAKARSQEEMQKAMGPLAGLGNMGGFKFPGM